MEWTIRELADRAGISPRTLRHYHQIGLLTPDRIGDNGYRYYGSTAGARLLRILLLRDTGMSLADIATALADEDEISAEIEALEGHLIRLRQERDVLDGRIAAVEHTLMMRRQGEQPRMDVMLEGFNDRHEQEVTQRWGREVFEESNRWWHAKSIDQQRRFQVDAEKLLTRWGELYDQGLAPEDATAQDHAAVHLAWLAGIPGTPVHAGDTMNTRAMLFGLANLYSTNSDFHTAFGGAEAAIFAGQALRKYTDQHFPE